MVPTWNYLTVHAYGAIQFYDDPKKMRDHIAHLTDTHERARAAPWAVEDAPPDFIDKMIGGIIGFTIAVTRFEGKWKMSQNRLPHDIEGVREGLAHEGGCAQEAVAGAMNDLYGQEKNR